MQYDEDGDDELNQDVVGDLTRASSFHTSTSEKRVGNTDIDAINVLSGPRKRARVQTEDDTDLMMEDDNNSSSGQLLAVLQVLHYLASFTYFLILHFESILVV